MKVSMHQCEVELIPFVMTWDGIVTKYHNIHVKKIGLDNKTRTYIQSIALKKTLEAISFDYRRQNMLKGIKREVAIAEACEETAKTLELKGETAFHGPFLVMENTEEITHEFYDTHAHEFSATRYKTWPKIKNFLENTNGLLLDAGCGNGRNMVQDSIGVDFSFNLLQEAYAKNPQNDFIQSNVLKLPFCDSVFDRILSIAVVHHLNTHERRLMALSELHRVLKDDGHLLIYVWDKNAATNKKFKCIGNNDYLVDWRNSGCMRYYHMYTLDSFTEFLQATNFRILEIGVEQESLYAKLQK